MYITGVNLGGEGGAGQRGDLIREATKLKIKGNRKTLCIIQHIFYFFLWYETQLHNRFIIFYLEDVLYLIKPSKMKYACEINYKKFRVFST